MRARNTKLWQQNAGRILEAFFQHTLEPMAILDLNFNFIRVNQAYADVASCDRDDFIGLNHFEVYPHAENERIFRTVVASRKPYMAMAKPFAHPDQPDRGVTYWNWKLTPLLDDDGEVQYLVFSLEDVTDETCAKEELRVANVKLERRARQLQLMAAELSATEDRERARLAEILHDDLQQRLAAAKFQLSLAVSRAGNGEDVQEQLRDAEELLDGSIKKSRSLSHELCPPVLNQYGLGAALEWLSGQMQEMYNLGVELVVGADAEPSTDEMKSLAFKAVQELLFNAVKHANVDKVNVNLQRAGRQIQILVSDDGKGFNHDAVLEAGERQGFGILSLRERLDFLGGALLIKSGPGQGSEFVICMPEDGQEAEGTEGDNTALP